MRRVAWATDIHLEFVEPSGVEAFVDQVKAHHPDMLLLSGDIGTAKNLEIYLRYITLNLGKPVCFVLGNHDFYGSDISDVRASMRALTEKHMGAVWLPAIGVVELAPDVALVGHDGWSDGRNGRFMESSIFLNDYVMIRHLANIPHTERLRRLNALGDEAAAYLREVLGQALANYHHIIVMTHPPPYREACWYNGETARPDSPYLPHFSCKAIGDLLLATADAYPEHHFTVLCGHTHGRGEVRMRDNLHVVTGGAEYGDPQVQQVFEYPL